MDITAKARSQFWVQTQLNPAGNNVIKNWFFSVPHLCFPESWLHSQAGPSLMVSRWLLEAPDLYLHNSTSSLNQLYISQALIRACAHPWTITLAKELQSDWPVPGQMPIPGGRGSINTIKLYGVRVGKRREGGKEEGREGVFFLILVTLW